MAYTAQDPVTEAKALLNDPNGHIYPDDRVLPLLQKAYRELQQKFMLNGVVVLKEVSADIPVTAGTVLLGDGSGLPSDFVSPIELEERSLNSSELFQSMKQLDWEPNAHQGPSLHVWNFREEEIKFLGATSDREIRLKYYKGLTRITSLSTPIPVIGAVTFLAARTAAIAAYVIGENGPRSEALNGDAGMALHELLAMHVKQRQSLPIRRRVNRYRR